MINENRTTIAQLIEHTKENKLQTLRLNRRPVINDTTAGNLSINGNETRYLSIDENEPPLEKIPEQIFELEQLTVLDLSNNKIDVIPAEILKLKNLKSLSLEYNSLNEFPSIISKLPNLESLNLNSNSIKTIPSSISELHSLVNLEISDAKLTDFPLSITNLETLRSINLSGLQLKTIPQAFAKLQNLNTLNISNNKLNSIPKCIFKLPYLTNLNLSLNRIIELPSAISRLKNLQTLSLFGNKLTDLPKALTNLNLLEILVLWNNRFDKIPDVIYELTNLQYVSFNNLIEDDNFVILGEKIYKNQIQEISPKILNLTNLKDFDVTGNPITSPPPEIVEQGIEAIRNYFRLLNNEEKDYLYEAKLLIVGEGGAGKTTLARKIIDEEYQLTESEKSTEGIEVTKYNFTEDGKRFCINIWDFGGQEIYHATHQFFLTKRSLYILVADTRREDTDFFYWLNVVDLLSEQSPLLIVKNEKQDRHREINENQLRGQFPNLKETLSSNLSTNRGLSNIVSHIKHNISTLPHIGTPLPKSWVKVREKIETTPNNHIKIEDYLNICQQEGFSTKEDKLHLMDFLHDLGVCLYFKNDALLKKIVILKPKWGTDAVYKVLDNKLVIKNLGRFNKADLSKIWNDEEYADMQDELLQLMINFKLCYKIPNSELYIAPQLLSENQPEYQWNGENNLILRYEYEFMPKGIITQFIVETHMLIENQDKVWKTGVILNKDETRAEVIEYYGKRELIIRVEGAQKKELLTIIHYEIEKIHSTFKRLKYSPKIPCNCTKCRNSQQPFFYDFDVLRQFIRDRKQDILCYKSYETVNVFSLVDDLLIPKDNFNEINPVDSIISNLSSAFDFKYMGNKTVQIATKIENYEQSSKIGSDTIQTINEGDVTVVNEKEPIKSAWANGSFYLFTFVVVIAGLGFLSNNVSFWTLPVILIAGILFVPIIGALQLRQDNRLSDKSFVELIKITVGQLPLIGRFLNKSQLQSK